MGNKFAAVTASLGEQSHVFIKAQERRMHYNGQNSIFTVRFGQPGIRGRWLYKGREVDISLLVINKVERRILHIK